jgi:hypothetical protein
LSFLVFAEREAPKYLKRPICIIRHSSRKSIQEFINACPFWLLENQLKNELDLRRSGRTAGWKKKT